MNIFTRKNYHKWSNIFALLAVISVLSLFAGILLFPNTSNWAIYIPGILGGIFAFTSRILVNISFANKKAYDNL